MNTTEEVKQLVKSYMEATNRGDKNALTDMLAPEATFTLWGRLPVSGVTKGRRAILEEFMPGARLLFQPGTLQQEVLSIIADDTHAAIEVASRGTAADGTPYKNTYCMVIDVNNDKITAIREYMDTDYAQRVLCDPSKNQGEC